MTRRHKKAAALAEAMKREDETEKQRLAAQRDNALGKIDALKAMRTEQIDSIEQSAKEQVQRTQNLFAEMIDDEQRRIAEIDKQLRDLEGEEGVAHNGEDRPERPRTVRVSALVPAATDEAA